MTLSMILFLFFFFFFFFFFPSTNHFRSHAKNCTRSKLRDFFKEELRNTMILKDGDQYSNLMNTNVSFVKWVSIIVRYVNLDRKRHCLDSSNQEANPHQFEEFVTRVSHDDHELFVMYYVVLELNNTRIVINHIKSKSRQWLTIITRTRKMPLKMEYEYTLQRYVIIGILILLPFSNTRPEK